MSEKRRSGLVLHSDQGTRYTSYAYHVLTKEYNITLSMSRRGNCLDNAVIEKKKPCARFQTLSSKMPGK